MKEKKVSGSRVHKIVLICVSVFSLVLLILTLMERAGLRLTAAARRYGGTDGHGQRTVPQPDRADDAQARFRVGEKGQVDAPENAQRCAQEKRNHDKKVHL